MLVAFFRYIHENLPAATLVQAWKQTKPFSTVTIILKFSAFANNNSNNARDNFRTNAFSFCNTLTAFRLPGQVSIYLSKKFILRPRSLKRSSK